VAAPGPPKSLTAAQALAHRVSAEIGSTPGDLVGYQVRFVDRTSPRTLVKLMTDGLLLRELESDPLLERYDTLILDENPVGHVGSGQIAWALAHNRCHVLRTLSLQGCDITNCMELAYRCSIEPG